MLWVDWHRRRRIRHLIATNAPGAPEDEYRAGITLQHGLRLEAIVVVFARHGPAASTEVVAR